MPKIIKILSTLKNKKIILHTKQKKIIKGTLKKIDNEMNLLIDDQVVKGNFIRYLIFDDEIKF